MGLWEAYGSAFRGQIQADGNAGAAAGHDRRATAAAPAPAEPDRAERAALDDAAWRQWLDACSRYYMGCFSCAEAILDHVYFCRAANRAVFGSDVIEVELIKDDGAGSGASASQRAGAGPSPAAGRPAIPGRGRHGVRLDLDLSGVHPFRDRARRKGAA